MPLRVAFVIAFAAAPTWAQPVDSFRELAELIEIGRSVVVVTSPSGAVITGRLVDISPASLSVFAGGRRVELDETRVRRVRQGWNDPIADGAVLGFAVGVAPWLLADFIGTGSEEASLAPPVLSGVAGALIGATLDSIRSERLRNLYVRDCGAWPSRRWCRGSASAPPWRSCGERRRWAGSRAHAQSACRGFTDSRQQVVATAGGGRRTGLPCLVVPIRYREFPPIGGATRLSPTRSPLRPARRRCRPGTRREWSEMSANQPYAVVTAASSASCASASHGRAL